MPKKISYVTIAPDMGNVKLSFTHEVKPEWDPPLSVQGRYTQTGVRGPWEKMLEAEMKYISGGTIAEISAQMVAFASEQGMLDPYVSLDTEGIAYESYTEPVIKFRDTRDATDEEIEWIKKQQDWNATQAKRRDEEQIERTLRNLTPEQRAALKEKL